MITGHRKVLLARWTVLAGLAALWEAGAHWFGWVASISSPGEIWHAAFSVILHVTAGLKGVQPAHVMAARSMGASPIGLIWHVIFPAIAPLLRTGLQIAMSQTVLGVLIAELYVSTSGTGYFIRLYMGDDQPAALLAIIAVLAAIAIAFSSAARLLGRCASRSATATTFSASDPLVALSR